MENPEKGLETIGFYSQGDLPLSAAGTIARFAVENSDTTTNTDQRNGAAVSRVISLHRYTMRSENIFTQHF